MKKFFVILLLGMFAGWQANSWWNTNNLFEDKEILKDEKETASKILEKINPQDGKFKILPNIPKSKEDVQEKAQDELPKKNKSDNSQEKSSKDNSEDNKPSSSSEENAQNRLEDFYCTQLSDALTKCSSDSKLSNAKFTVEGIEVKKVDKKSLLKKFQQILNHFNEKNSTQLIMSPMLMDNGTYMTIDIVNIPGPKL